MFYLSAVYDNITEVNRKYFHWGECDNTRRECRAWAKQGMCQYKPDKMNSWCPWSCHMCAPEQMVIHKGCEDHSSSCKDWAKRGHCEEKPIFMFAFCRWTCKQCAKESVTTTVRDRMPQQCRKWVRNGDCYLHQAFMLQNCRKSCMAGGYVDGKRCLDSSVHCHRLARLGYCRESTSKSVMRKYCRYSCRWC
ncbi:putative tyrosinase-like protein tyr-3 [Orbicella faveolata]|uniref:putative tyrosinase-like protein tyr-3 n=1 Tax=Orbicella faveolata TaxID=48498 RepID=UPI0009E3C5EB|nr:putative tyrosinase-like protein tyr-3 [Orbicella faveolata]